MIIHGSTLDVLKLEKQRAKNERQRMKSSKKNTIEPEMDLDDRLDAEKAEIKRQQIIRAKERLIELADKVIKTGPSVCWGTKDYQWVEDWQLNQKVHLNVTICKYSKVRWSSFTITLGQTDANEYMRLYNFLQQTA